MPNIRFASLLDVAAVEEIENLADTVLARYLHASVWEPAPTGEARAAMSGFLLVAAESDNGGAIGFAHVLEVAGTAHLEQLSVRPDKSRQGVGRALVEAAMTEARAKGYGEMTLRTYEEVPWNAPFYATCGFVVTEPLTEFERKLVAIEEGLGLMLHGPRVQMTAQLLS